MKASKLIQHNLIPVTLIAGNVALAHLIYLIANGLFGLPLLTLAIIIVMMVLGVLRADKILLSVGSLAYTLLLLFTLLY